MSSKAKKIEEQAKEQRHTEELMLESTLLGTIVLSIGVLNKVGYEECLKYFKKTTENVASLPNTIIEIANYVWNDLGKDENKPLRANLVLLTDTEEVRSPMVGIVLNGEVVPITPNGISYGIMVLAREGRPNVDAEYLYDENGEDYFEDFEVTE